MDQETTTKLRAPLPIDRVEFRVQSISVKGWAALLAYKDARVDMDRLDAVFGADGWQRTHELIDGQLFGIIEIWGGPEKGWVRKMDVGVESYAEKEKGRASDSFKRACFNVGIGRELYDYPIILVKLNEDEYYTKDDKGKVRAFATYNLKLREWSWDADIHQDEETLRVTVASLAAYDEKGNERFRYPRKTSGQGKPPADPGPGDTTDGKRNYSKQIFSKQRTKMVERYQSGERTIDELINIIKENYHLTGTLEQYVRQELEGVPF